MRKENCTVCPVALGADEAADEAADDEADDEGDPYWRG